MNHRLNWRITAFVVIAIFALSSIPVAAGAHFDIGFVHKSGDKKHNHVSRFHLSEFSDCNSLAPKHEHTGSEAPVIRNAGGSCGYLADHLGHIHAAENSSHKQKDKSFINDEEQKYFGFVKLSIISPSVKVYKSLSHTILSIRGPPASLI